jgi:hypothetical protein
VEKDQSMNLRLSFGKKSTLRIRVSRDEAARLLETGEFQAGLRVGESRQLELLLRTVPCATLQWKADGDRWECLIPRDEWAALVGMVPSRKNRILARLDHSEGGETEIQLEIDFFDKNQDG